MFLGLALSAYACYREARITRLVSAAVWVPTLWMMRCASRGLDSWLGGGGSFEEGRNYDQIYLFLVALAGFIVVFRRSRAVTAVLRQNVPLVMLFAYMAISIIWSDGAFDSTKRLFRSVGDLVMALIIVSEKTPLEAMLAMFRRCLIFLIPISAALAKYYPQLGRMQEKNWEPDSWIGVATHKNTLGQLCFLAALVLAIELFQAMQQRGIRWWRLPLKLPVETLYLLVTVYLLNGGGQNRSSTSILVLVVGGVMYLAMGRFKARPQLVPRMFFALLCAFGLAQLMATVLFDTSLESVVAEMQGKDPTLAGRTDLWRDVFKIGNEHAILGAGYGGFWTPEMKARLKEIPRHSWGPQQAHNGYIEIYLNLGLVGLALFGWVVARSLRGATRLLTREFEYGRIRLVLVLAALLQNYTEAGFPRATHLVWFTFLVASLNPALRKRQLEPASRSPGASNPPFA